MKNSICVRNYNSNPFTFFEDLDKLFFNPRATSNVTEAFAPRCNFVEKDNHYLLSVDLPGIPKEEIKVEVENGRLKVSGERKKEVEEEGYFEKSYGKFERILTIPQEANADAIQAHHENGVLMLAIPKREKPAPQKIEITAGKKEGIWNKLLN